MDTLRKTEYGIYGLASANGFGEYITGKDMFGNDLSEEKRSQSLNEALFVLGASGMGMYADKLTLKNSVYAKPPTEKAPNNGKLNHINQTISQGISNLNSIIRGPKLAHEFAGGGTNVTVSSFKATLQRVNRINSRSGNSDISSINKINVEGAKKSKNTSANTNVIKDGSHFLDEYKLKPKVKYETNGYLYQTDDLGRIERASGELTLEMGGTEQ